MGTSSINGLFSMAMLNNQRVIIVGNIGINTHMNHGYNPILSRILLDIRLQGLHICSKQKCHQAALLNSCRYTYRVCIAGPHIMATLSPDQRPAWEKTQVQQMKRNRKTVALPEAKTWEEGKECGKSTTLIVYHSCNIINMHYLKTIYIYITMYIYIYVRQ